MRDGAPHTDIRPSVAIIGAGMAGLACARALKDEVKVTLFDKSRGIGGRMSTRYAGAYEFDHGAQFFTARDPVFQSLVEDAEQAGCVAHWEGQALYLSDNATSPDTGGQRWVGTPRMNAFPKWLTEGLDIRTGVRVSGIAIHGGHILTFEDGTSSSGFSAVVLAVPQPQALPLLPSDFENIATLRQASMDACFALMIGLERGDLPAFTSIRAKGLPVDWIARNSSKPERAADPATLVIHASAEWSNAHVEADRDHVLQILRKTASDLLFTDLSDAPHQVLHRWLYSSVSHGAGQLAFTDSAHKIVVCGDWCAGGRVEGAWQSGQAAARAVRALLS